MIIKVADQVMSVFLDNCSEVHVTKCPDTAPIIEGCFDLRTPKIPDGEQPPWPLTPAIAVNFKRLGEYGQVITDRPCYLLGDNGKTIERIN